MISKRSSLFDSERSKGDEMKYVGYLGIYIAMHYDRDSAFDVAWKIAKCIGMERRELGDLLCVIYTAHHYGVDDDLVEQAEATINKEPELAKIINSINNEETVEKIKLQ